MPQLGIIPCENAGLATAMAQSKFASLSAQYAAFSNYEGTSKPSLPDYSALIAGGYLFSQGVFGGNPAGKDGVFVVGQSTVPNMFSQLIAAGHSWKGYEEGVSGAGGYTTWGNAGTNNLHVARHCPASFFSQTQNPGTNHGNGRYDFDELVYDINHQSLPDYFWATPNTINSGHDTGVAAANTWLINGGGGVFPGIDALIAAMRPDGLLAITFDNVPTADTTTPITGSGKVYMVICGPGITHSSSSTYNNHFGFLRAAQNLFGLAKLTTGTDSNYTNATPLAMPTVTNPNPPPTPPTITSPLQGAVISATTVTVSWTAPASGGILPNTDTGKVYYGSSYHDSFDPVFASAADASSFAAKCALIVTDHARANGFESSLMAGNLNLCLYAYCKGVLTSTTTLPEVWYGHASATVASGNRITSGLNPSQLIMDVGNTSAQTVGGTVYNGFSPYHADIEIAPIIPDPYNGYFLDTEGYFGTFNGAQPNQAYSTEKNALYVWDSAPLVATDWKQKLFNNNDTLMARLPNKACEANMPKNGANYYQYAQGVEHHCHMTQFEMWLRVDTDAASAYPPDTTSGGSGGFQENVQAGLDVQLAGAGTHMKVQLQGSGFTAPTYLAWRIYALACWYLQNRGRSVFEIRADANPHDEPANALYTTNLGTPLDFATTVAAMRLTGATPVSVSGGTKTYGRRYTNGLVLVCTDDSASRTVTLDHADYTNVATGSPVGSSSLSIQPNQGVILTR